MKWRWNIVGNIKVSNSPEKSSIQSSSYKTTKQPNLTSTSNDDKQKQSVRKDSKNTLLSKTVSTESKTIDSKRIHQSETPELKKTQVKISSFTTPKLDTEIKDILTNDILDTTVHVLPEKNPISNKLPQEDLDLIPSNFDESAGYEDDFEVSDFCFCYFFFHFDFNIIS